MGTGHAHALFLHEHSKIHYLAPEAKLAAGFLFVVAAAITPREAVWAFLLYLAALIALIRIAKLRFSFLAARLTVIIPFILFAVFLPFVSSGERIEVLGIGISLEGAWAAWNVFAKASIGASVSIVLAATTELPDLIRGMERLRVPAVMTAIAGFMIRYLELIADELGRMRVAMTARGYDPRWIWQAKPIAASAGAMFIRSYERGERVYDAMLSRGYQGSMPDLGHKRASHSDWRTAITLPLLGIIISVVALRIS
jgi:cobalt/nickel transport system permease protein